ncbi:MAG: FAD-dependent monooxygenase [Verrucomicrobiales bacterium]|nr:FAD-dependent monooxygenase [Verrucomicrobiales bacterium]
MKPYEVAIIGASVSGASLAIRLGKAGLKTALIDKQTFPRKKACGEGVSDIALDSLYELGLKEEIEQLGGKPFFSFRIGLDQHSVTFARSSQPRLKGIGIPRYRLDKLLVDHASHAPSVTPFLGSAVTDIQKTASLHLLSLADGQQITARYLVLADGTNSANARKLGIPKTSKTRSPLWGINFVMEGEYQSTTGEVSILLKDGYEVYCTPVSDTTLNVALLARKDKLLYLQEKNLQQQLLLEAAEKSCFQGEVIGRPLTVGPVGSNKRPYIYDSTLLLGDTSESLDPIAGMGITHGILMSKHAANALTSIFQHGESEEKAFKNYTADCKEMSRIYRGFTQLTASLFRSPLRKVLIPALSVTQLPFLINNALRYESASASASNLYLPFTKFLQFLGG